MTNIEECNNVSNILQRRHVTIVDGGELRGRTSCKTEIENGSNIDDSLIAIIDHLNYTHKL